ncbi:hypothetical protein M9Y10_023650 [Tritrichomonas musculus]|uniref:Uncharacterized protein n=1 Tax=Tritrichomonas musculus TaxID=1915356 RepID=A0ABR2KVR5_9EUKA
MTTTDSENNNNGELPLPKKIEPKKKAKRGSSAECQIVAQLLENFIPENSIAFIRLKEKYGFGLTHAECQSIADVISIHLGIKLEREARRRFPSLIKWFDDNWTSIEPNLKFLILSVKENPQEILNDIIVNH